MEMLLNARDCDKIRKKVLILSSLFFTIQALGFAGTMVFYWFAQSDQYRDILAKPIITSLYHRYQWRWLRKEHAMEVMSMLLLIGIARRIKCLLIPWLVTFGLTQMAVLGSVLACVIYLPSDFKLLGIGVAAAVAFVLFPWWFAVIHLFAVINKRFEADDDDSGMGFNNNYDMTNTECSCDNRSLHSRIASCRSLTSPGINNHFFATTLPKS